MSNDIVGAMMDFESGTLSPDDTIKMFSELISTGDVWSLQGSYTRAAMTLIDEGFIGLDGKILKGLSDV